MSHETRLAKRRERYRLETEEQRLIRKRDRKKTYYKHLENNREKSRLANKENSEVVYNRRKQSALENPKKYLVMIAKCRAKRLGQDFSITENDFDIPITCPILGVRLGRVFSSKEERGITPSLDRIDNSKGYIPGNIAVISYDANRYKSNLSLEQIQNLYNYTRKNNCQKN